MRMVPWKILGKNMETKSAVRKKIIDIRNQLNKNQIQEKSNYICEIVKNNSIISQSNKIFVYSPLGTEVDICPVIQFFFESGKMIYFPKVFGKDMEFYRVRSMEQLEEGTFHVNEPIDGLEKFEIEKCQNVSIIILVPGVAFSTKGARIGYGKGYYDRYISRLKCSNIKYTTFGIGYDFQMVDEFNSDIFDQDLDYIITDKKEVRCNV